MNTKINIRNIYVSCVLKKCNLCYMNDPHYNLIYFSDIHNVFRLSNLTKYYYKHFNHTKLNINKKITFKFIDFINSFIIF